VEFSYHSHPKARPKALFDFGAVQFSHLLPYIRRCCLQILLQANKIKSKLTLTGHRVKLNTYQGCLSIKCKNGNTHGLLWKTEKEMSSSQRASCQWKIPFANQMCLVNYLNLPAPHSLSICFLLHWCSTGTFTNGYLPPKPYSNS